MTRVLYAIENGGFSGAIMPQNVVVGQQAQRWRSSSPSTPDGRRRKVVGQTPCQCSRSARCRWRRPPPPAPRRRLPRRAAGQRRRRRLGPAPRSRRPPAGEGSILDIRLIRRDPDAVRAALARRSPEAAAAVDRVLELDERWRALTAQLEELRAEQNRASSGRKGAPTPRGARAAGGARRPRSRAERGGGGDPQAARRRRSLAAEPPGRRRARRGQGAEGGRRGRRDRPGSSRAGGLADRHGARRAHVGIAVRVSARRARAARVRARALCAREAPRAGSRAGDPAGARARAGAVRHRLPARHRAADLPARRTTTSTWSGPRRSRWPRCTATRSWPPTRCRCRYAGFSTCFRREAGAAGKDTRGIFRVHQFDKVEMFCFVEPEQAPAEHERLLAIEESILQELEIPYRVRGDRGRRPRRLGGQEVRLRGVAAGSGALSRADLVLEHDRLPGAAARHPLPRADGRPAHVHTLNGTAVAVGRTIIALLENGQRDDGSVALPAILPASARRSCWSRRAASR